MSGTSEAVRLIELTSARLWHGIDGAADAARDAADEQHGSPLPDLGVAGMVADRRALLDAAWGPNDQALTAEQLSVLAAGLPAHVAIDLSGLQDGCVLPPRTGRVVLNLLLLAAECLPSGGTVVLAGSADDLFVQIDGRGIAWPAGMAACIVDEAAACAAMTDERSVQMPLTTLLAHASGVRLSFLVPPSSQMQPPILRVGGD